MNSITLSEKDIARFWSKVDVKGPDECWEWRGTMGNNGYGQFSVGPRSTNKTMKPSRLSWMINKGAIPEGILVCHKCDNRPCVNPNHLFLGTNLENTRDKMKKGRYGQVVRRRGENHPSAKLKEVDVLEIRKLLKEGASQLEISRKFKVLQATISSIKRRKIWKWLI